MAKFKDIISGIIATVFTLLALDNRGTYNGWIYLTIALVGAYICAESLTAYDYEES